MQQTFFRSALALLLLSSGALMAAEARFSGAAQLAPDKQLTSADHRFSLDAELQAAPVTAKSTADGRFSVLADLAAPKSLATACGPSDLIFQNGFQP
jgi:hypothetical protein